MQPAASAGLQTSRRCKRTKIPADGGAAVLWPPRFEAVTSRPPSPRNAQPGALRRQASLCLVFNKPNPRAMKVPPTMRLNNFARATTWCFTMEMRTT